MPKHKLERQQDPLTLLKQSIKTAKKNIEREFDRSQNPWPSCFGSCVFQVETYLSLTKRHSLLSEGQCTSANERLNELKVELQQVKRTYPLKQAPPPKEVRDELLRKLDILRDD